MDLALADPSIGVGSKRAEVGVRDVDRFHFSRGHLRVLYKTFFAAFFCTALYILSHLTAKLTPKALL